VKFKLCNSESLWIKLSGQSNSSYTIGIIYCHSHSTCIDDFIENFSNCLSELNLSKQTYFILGDINVNIAASNRSQTTEHYLNMLTSYSAFPIITKPTRITVIDHIITNDTYHLVMPNVIQTDTIRDHYPILCLINNTHLPKKAN